AWSHFPEIGDFPVCIDESVGTRTDVSMQTNVGKRMSATECRQTNVGPTVRLY
ncbi:MAG: hypothetical protein ACI91Q_001104, partial [Gammaproteobacteria bacterium]